MLVKQKGMNEQLKRKVKHEKEWDNEKRMKAAMN